jgi:CRP-like cAMP-binding protein
LDPKRLKDIPLFSELSRRDRKLVAEHADEVDVPSGTTLIEQGRLAYEFFVITEGSADVFDGDEKIAAVGPGEVLGEMGVLETHKRTATVVATSPMSLIVIYGPELTALTAKMPDIMDRLNAIIQERSPDSA